MAGSVTVTARTSMVEAARVAAGVHIVPLMPADQVVALAVEAERLGYDYCLLADEGFHPDIYACLGVIARETDRITIGAMTNGYTRHPAVTAAALATVNELSGGRAMVTVLAGGSMVLAPMGIERARPFRVVSDTVEILRRLWSGQPVTWAGTKYGLDAAQLAMGAQDIPIWLAGRGPLILGLAGRSADGALLTVKPDLAAALGIVDESAATSQRRPKRIYLGRICYTPEMLQDQRVTLSFVLMDSPRRVLQSLGLDEPAVDTVQRASRENRPDLVAPLVTDDLLRRYQVAGSPAECTDEVRRLVGTHALDAILVDVLSTDHAENLALMRDTLPIISGG
ncbi:MAG: LLM class flavin-dependent oxidoreductase [Acidimicrobiales bacterium]